MDALKSGTTGGSFGDRLRTGWRPVGDRLGFCEGVSMIQKFDLPIFAREFVVLLGVALALAVPVTWLVTERWLESFAYRVDVTAMPFLQAATIALLIAMLSIARQIYRTARMNPTQSLRSE